MKTQSYMATIVGVYDFALRAAISFIFAAVLCLVFLGVICRFFPFLGSLFWTEEVAFYLITWTVFLAIAPGIRKATHMKIDLFVELLPPALRQFVHLVGVALVGVFLLFMVVKGYSLTLINMDRPSPVLLWPLSWAYFAVPIGGFLGLLEILASFWRIWTHHDKADHVSLGEGVV
jgi:TRAP-type C4-dicarboxylate transport system permease small subunit